MNIGIKEYSDTRKEKQNAEAKRDIKTGEQIISYI
jgi:hypothetical protein